MKIFSAAQIRAWDAYTIKNEPILSIELMNRAARVFTNWFVKKYRDSNRPVIVFAGTGNNGGDGLAVARMLDQQQYNAKVLVCDFGGRHSADFDAQMALIAEFSAVKPQVFRSFAEFQESSSASLLQNQVIIDSLFGSGISRPLEGDWAQLIDFLNNSDNEIVSIDLPSGLSCDAPSFNNPVLKATRTFSFETPKLAFFFPENAGFLGKWDYGSIGLHPDFEKSNSTAYYFLTDDAVRTLRLPRTKFSHKGRYGHALLIAGAWGKMGAAVLAARACLRSGVGLLTIHTPGCGNMVLQSTVPEAMLQVDQAERHWTEIPDLQGFSSIGLGPGIGRAAATAVVLKDLIKRARVPLVLDADALNLMAENLELLSALPQNSILTPHPKEFERLFGKTEHDFQRNELQRSKAQQYAVFIILKGAHTAIACPDGTCWFNSTGNPGMATGGSGDVLTGILTGLLAQGYDSKTACLLGVFLHGLAGDLAAEALGQEAMIAGDLIEYLGRAWLELDLE